ncbi:unnamed protein product [Rotaria sp. Silwood1]|nr:unnamed protein product [Rotaria sp. Silwood1]CAF4930600.1 unnamed protein product [Rotaria sp. Silwood1]
MSTTASRYADYNSACPRCQQIINTIDITFQQGIFIYDLTFIQQELESILISALQRQKQLLQSDGENLILPLSSMIQLINGKKPRDFKAERERKRKAFSGQITRKRRRKKKISNINLIKPIKRERNQNNYYTTIKKNFLEKKSNENYSKRPIRSYRPINFTYPFYYETNSRNNHNLLTKNKLQLNNMLYPDQFWMKIIQYQHEFIKKNDWNYIEKLINIDQTLFDNINDEKIYNQYKQIINSNEYLLTNNKYLHPELEYSIVIKQNLHLYNFVENFLNNNQNKNNSILNNHRLKRKYSSISNNHNSIDIDDSILKFFQRDNNTFPSKYAELQHRLAESISLERLALDRAEKQYKLDSILIELNEIDDKILEITNSIRQRKRPNENAISLCKLSNPINNNHNHQQNGTNDNDSWRKGRRQSTLRIYDELARLVDERINIEKQLIDITPYIEL